MMSHKRFGHFACSLAFLIGTFRFGEAHDVIFDTTSWSQIGSLNEKCALDGFPQEAKVTFSRAACQKEAEIAGAPFYSYISQRANLELRADPAPSADQDSVIVYTPVSYPPYICRSTDYIETDSGTATFDLSYQNSMDGEWIHPEQDIHIQRKEGSPATSWEQVATGFSGPSGGIQCYRRPRYNGEKLSANLPEKRTFKREAYNNCLISQSCKLADTHNCPTPQLCQTYGTAVAYSSGWRRYGKQFCSEDEFVVSHACRKCPPGTTSTGAHDSLGPDTACLCSNEPSRYMRKSDRSCETSLWEIENRCNKDPYWVEQLYCQQSCYDAGYGYRQFNEYGHGDVCKVETEDEKCERRESEQLTELSFAMDTLKTLTFELKQLKVFKYPTLHCAAPTGLAAGVTTTCSDFGILDVTTCDFDCAAGYSLSGSTESTCDASTVSYQEPSIVFTAIICAGDEYVSTNECVACAIDSFNAAGDGTSGSDTTCKPKSCGADQYLSSNTCRDCAPGTTNGSGDNAMGSNTECTVTYCESNERVKNKVCTACVAGETNDAGDDASGWNTACDEPNKYVVESSATLQGVTLTVANSVEFKTAFKGGIAEQFAVSSSDVTIGTIVEGRRRLSGGVTIPFTITTTSASSAAGFKDVTVNTANIQTKILADYSGAENLSEMTVESVEDVQDVETNPILSTAASRAPMQFFPALIALVFSIWQ